MWSWSIKLFSRIPGDFFFQQGSISMYYVKYCWDLGQCIVAKKNTIINMNLFEHTFNFVQTKSKDHQKKISILSFVKVIFATN